MDVASNLAILRGGLPLAVIRQKLATLDDGDVALPATCVAPGTAEEASRGLSSLDAGGSTDLCAGWMRGCEEVAHTLTEDARDRPPAPQARP